MTPGVEPHGCPRGVRGDVGEGGRGGVAGLTLTQGEGEVPGTPQLIDPFSAFLFIFSRTAAEKFFGVLQKSYKKSWQKITIVEAQNQVLRKSEEKEQAWKT